MITLKQHGSHSTCHRGTRGSCENADSDSVGLGWSLGFQVSSKSPCNAEAACPRITSWQGGKAVPSSLVVTSHMWLYIYKYKLKYIYI